jgi:hypothetical protein
VTGSGLGAFAFPPLIEFLLDHFGWRQTLFLFGAIWLHVLPAGALFRPAPVVFTENSEATNVPDRIQNEEEGDLQNKSIEMEANREVEASIVAPSNSNHCCSKFWQELKSLTLLMLDKSLASCKPYLLFTAATFLLYLFVGMPYVYLMDKAVLQGVSNNLAAFLFSIIGIGRTIGQLLLGFVGNLPQVNTLFLYGVSLCIVGAGTLLVPVCFGYTLLSIFSFAFGFFVSVTYTLQMMCLVLMVGLERSANAFGLLQLVQGIATLLGTPIPGLSSSFYFYPLSHP